jgi:hypothetical protein
VLGALPDFSSLASVGNVCLVYQSIYSGCLSLWNRDSRLRGDSQPNSVSTARKDVACWSIVESQREDSRRVTVLEKPTYLP